MKLKFAAPESQYEWDSASARLRRCGTYSDSAHSLTRYIDLLGLLFEVECLNTQSLATLELVFGALTQPTSLRSADVKLRLSDQCEPRYLYRQHPSDSVALAGVEVWNTVLSAYEPWTSTEPPLMPMSHPALSQRFLALHAGCVQLDTKCVLFVGERGTGKTTLARRLCDFGGKLLTDETAFIHRRSTMIEPLPLAMGVRQSDGIGKRLAQIATMNIAVQQRCQTVSHCVSLRRGDNYSITRFAKGSAKAFELLCRNIIETGLADHETLITLHKLIHSCPLIEVCWRHFEDFDRIQSDVIEFTKNK